MCLISFTLHSLQKNYTGPNPTQVGIGMSNQSQRKWTTFCFWLQLEQIPPTIGLLKNLVILNLCNNRLRQVPKQLGLLQNLQMLYLGLNQLQMLPTAIGNLKELVYIGLSDNKFSSVPKCLANLQKLEKVNLDRNPFPPPPDEKKVEIPRRFFLAHARDLCKDCRKNCRIDRDKMEETTQMKEATAGHVPRVETVI